MANTIFNDQDLEDIQSRGISKETAIWQIEMLRKGIPFANLDRACIIGDGIVRIEENVHDRLKSIFKETAATGRITKFTPASGAATRMFKSLLTVRNDFKGASKKTLSQAAQNGNDDVEKFLWFFANIKKFAFYDDLNAALAKQGTDTETLIREEQFDPIIDTLLSPSGLNYANLSKGAIAFHKYPEGNRSAFEEQLAEAATYAKDASGVARICFTISNSPENEKSAKDIVENASTRLESDDLRFEVQWMYQKPSTDTIAVDENKMPFRESNETLHFRPGGHGALLENINDLQGDIVFIKNIDNVVPDRLKGETYHYKMVLGGYLIEVQNRIFGYLEKLSTGTANSALISEICDFAKTILSLDIPANIETADQNTQVEFLFAKLNRPLRVCGMVKNQGEPGGGPFWVIDTSGVQSLQLVETSQIDKGNEQQRRVLESSTHFSPVDLVCGLRDFRGDPFDLLEYRDEESCFISRKSSNGRELFALEYPGLWNGGMAFWNTIFVEVPLITFNPVKTVFDLLRDEHQPGK